MNTTDLGYETQDDFDDVFIITLSPGMDIRDSLDEYAQKFILIGDGLNDEEYELQAIISTNYVRSQRTQEIENQSRTIKWNGQCYCRHGENHSSWWHQSRKDPMCLQNLYGAYTPPDLVTNLNATQIIVYIRTRKKEMEVMRKAFFKYMGGQQHCQCKNHRTPLIPSPQGKELRCSIKNCKRQAYLRCPDIFCETSICKRCFESITQSDDVNYVPLDTDSSDEDSKSDGDSLSSIDDNGWSDDEIFHRNLGDHDEDDSSDDGSTSSGSGSDSDEDVGDNDSSIIGSDNDSSSGASNTFAFNAVASNTVRSNTIASNTAASKSGDWREDQYEDQYEEEDFDKIRGDNDDNNLDWDRFDVLQSDRLEPNDYDNFISAPAYPDIPLEDRIESTGPMPTTNTGDITVNVIPMRSGEYVTGHVIMNQVGSSCSREKYHIEGYSSQKYFLQRFVSTQLAINLFHFYIQRE